MLKSAINKHFLRTFLLTGFFGALLNLFIDFFHPEINLLFIFTDLFVLAVPVSGWYLYKYWKNEAAVSVLLASMLIAAMVYLFFQTGGYFCGIYPAVIIMAGYFCALMLHGRVRMICLSAIILIMLFLLFYQVIYPERFVYSLETSVSLILGTGFPYVVIFLVISGSAVILRDKYEQSYNNAILKNQEIQEINKKMVLQNEELNSQKSEVDKLNHLLEMKLFQGIENLKIKDQQIAAYTFINAHNIRGSLARILGLVYLAENNADVTSEELLARIGIEAKEMDMILNQVTNEILLKRDNETES